MQPDQYIKECRRTEPEGYYASIKLVKEEEIRLLHATIGIATEAGEVLDVLKKNVFYGREFDREHFLKELGDVMWYLAIAADTVGSDLSEVMDKNIEKLRARYPGRFTRELANNRKPGDI